MTDNEKRAHDIALALLSKGMSETNTDVYCYDSNDNGYVNAICIVDTYREIYDSILEELSSRE